MSGYSRDFAEEYNVNFQVWGGAEIWPLIAERLPDRMKSETTWLDVGCASGQFLRYLSDQGVGSITGIDNSARLLAYAAENTDGVTLVEADMRTYETDQRFDVVSCIGGTLNHLESSRELVPMLERLCGWLKPGGHLLLDINTEVGYIDNHGRMEALHHDDRVTVLEISYDEARRKGILEITGFAKCADSELYRRFDAEHLLLAVEPESFDAKLAEQELAFDCIDAHTFESPDEESARLLYICS